MHEIPGGSDFRPHDDYDISPPSVCWGFSLALTVSELKALFFISWQYDYIFDCFSVVVHWISMEASKQV